MRHPPNIIKKVSVPVCLPPGVDVAVVPAGGGVVGGAAAGGHGC